MSGQQVNRWDSKDSSEEGGDQNLEHSLLHKSPTSRTFSSLAYAELSDLDFWLQGSSPAAASSHETTRSCDQILSAFSTIEIPTTSIASGDPIATRVAIRDPELRSSEEGEPSGTNCVFRGGKSKTDDEIPRRTSKRSQPRRSRSAELHNMSEKVRRDRIKTKMKALQGLIPNSNARETSSVLDDAVKYIKSLQDHIKMIAEYQMRFTEPGSGYMLQAANCVSSQGVPYGQFMQMRPGVSMPMYGMTSTPHQTMPFAFASPSQPNVAAPWMPMFGPMPQMQMTSNPFGSLHSTDTTSQYSMSSCSTHGEGRSRSEPIAHDLIQVPPMFQALGSSGSTARVLPSRIVTPTRSGDSTAEIQRKPKEAYGDSGKG